MNRTELAKEILYALIDNSRIVINYGQEFYEEGVNDCIDDIKEVLEDYVIVEGRAIE